MKISLSISPDEPPRAPIIYKGGIEKGIKKAAELGFDGVELHVHHLWELDIPFTKNLLDSRRLGVSAVSPGLIYGGDTFSFSDEDEHVRQQAVDRVKLQIDVSSRLGAQVLVGVVHGRLDADPQKRKVELARINEKMGEIDAYALEKGTKLAIEAINRYEINCFNRAMEIVDLIKENDLRASGVLLDTFHMNIEEASIEEAIRSTGNYLCYVHFPDSNRWYPGAGHLNLKSIIGALKDIGYEGYLSLETLPLPTPEIAAERGFETVRRLLE